MAKWEFEPGHTAAGFKVKHMMVTWVRGSFRPVTGTLEYDSENIASSSLDITIQVKDISTGDAKRDEHLLSKDFFDVENYPTITFKSTRIDGNKEKLQLKGDLTIRDVTKEVTLDVELVGEWNTSYWEDGVDKGPIPRMGFVGTTKVNRQDFGVSWQGEMEKSGVVVGNEVFITIDAEILLKN
jgi:polyisoprenoid-binding protein YceI